MPWPSIPNVDRMYFADSLKGVVSRYDYDLETGIARNETVFVDFTGLPGRPTAHVSIPRVATGWRRWHGGAVLRFTPDGSLDRKIDVPVMMPTMTAFGGSDLGTLFVTSIGGGGSHPLAAGQPRAGDLFALDPGVTGLPDAPFAGL